MLYYGRCKAAQMDLEQSVKIQAFITEMGPALAAADVVVSRAGAIALSEFCSLGKACVLVPSPNVAENHQFLNAKTIEEKDACICIEEKDLELIFKNKLDLLINDENLRKELSRNISRMGLPNASSDIVEIIKKHFNDEP